MPSALQCASERAHGIQVPDPIGDQERDVRHGAILTGNLRSLPGFYDRIRRPSSRKMPLNIMSSACGLLALPRASASVTLRAFTRS